MIATVPLNRIGARFDPPPCARPALPQGERARGQFWSDAVFEAVQALRIQLHSRSEPIAAAAANSILELERTRMRHDKCLAGSRNTNEAQEEFEQNPSGCDEDEDEDEDDDAGEIAETDSDHGTPFENHARTLRRYYEEVLCQPMTQTESERFVAGKLREWSLLGSGIARNEFVNQMRSRGELPEPSGPVGK